MPSEAADELSALYLNAKYGFVIRNTLEEMVHPQPATPLQADNSTAEGTINRTITRSIESHGHEFLLTAQLGEPKKSFQVYRPPVSLNLVDYYTKHHQAAYHRAILDIYLHRKEKNPRAGNP